MASITICVPVYKPRDFLRQALESVRRQSFQDFQVLAAVEPIGEKDISFLGRILNDSRFSFSWNREVLGWAANIASLLRRVSTEFFAILPHDDALHPEYLSTLHEALAQNAEASVAYADMLLFGHEVSAKSRRVENDSLFDRLWAFYMGGAEAVPWRGLTRSRVLEGSKTFPDNCYTGFGVEYEWAQYLSCKGPIIRCADTLYYKRMFEPTAETVSRGWLNHFTVEVLSQALEWHRNAMLAGIPTQLSTHEKLALTLACEVAMMRRWLIFHRGRQGFNETQWERIRYVRKHLDELANDRRDPLLARLEDCVSRAAYVTGDLGRAMEHGRLAVALDPRFAESRVQFAQVLLSAGRPHDALAEALRLVELEPLTAGHRQVFENCVAAVERDLTVTR